MVIKSIIMLLLFLGPIIAVSLNGVTHPFAVVCMYIISGLGMAGIGMGIMHDAIHGSYTKTRWINEMMSNTINLIGASKDMWRIQHNVLHHSFTNIDSHDDDINPPFFLRFSPHKKRTSLHRFQHFYAWLFYGLTTLSWVTSKDYINLVKFNKMGLIKDRKTFNFYIAKITFWKLIFFLLVIGMPLLFSQASIGLILVSFLVMQFITGLCITTVFQAAHVVPNTDFPMVDDDGKIKEERMVHQLQTTSNFAQKGSFLFWCVGGLTNQIEHHLFPHISHVHYRKISKIVRETAAEFNLPYHTHGSFYSAIKQHFLMLKRLGLPQ